MKKIILLSKYGAWEENSFYRFYQYIQDFELKGIQVISVPLFTQRIEKKFINYSKISIVNYIISYFKRIYFLLMNEKNSLIWLDTELFPFIPFELESLLINLDTPVILDIYNSFFYKYSHGINFLGKKILKNKIPYWIGRAEEVITSCNSIYNFCKQYRDEVQLIPLAIDEKKVQAFLPEVKQNHEYVLGWTGTPFTARFLNQIINPLKELARYFPLKVKLIGGLVPLPVKTEYYTWSRSNELELLVDIDIGINPLPATLREIGNPCLKTLKYMSLGKPVVASSYGGSENFVVHSENGFLVKSEEDWYIALRNLLDDEEVLREMGEKSKERVVKFFQKEDAFLKMYLIFEKYF